ncbi:mannonate dehydratase [Rubellimicrobium roseum]|uniref:Mannonate dehydratase n=1 Tax=Rubellimicrobium roseum TaxID=687525 RepID=A0A5C4N584_9RHOB|nr:mannonate dehydratase [Rubellimicrobium roseum]TNC64210.1 mannonate dehydratase [Rubellimicrobium roseum]
MIECWRWFGPADPIRPADIAQTGAVGVVTALHEIPYGEVWPPEAIAQRQAEVARGPGLTWQVVESLPIHEDIKRGEGDLTRFFANYRQSLANLAAAGVRTVCYNFMPLIDWTRTDLAAPLPRGGTALRFDAAKMAALDIHMLGRPGAEADWSEDVQARARTWFDLSKGLDRDELMASVMAGLPGAYDRYDIPGLRIALGRWAGMDRDTLRGAFARFLVEVVPAAEDLGIRLCVHPDDPPRDLLGLPRIVSTESDIAWLLGQVESPANGLTLCAGSLGAGPANDPVAIAQAFAGRIAFAHLRNVAKEPDGSFQESEHLRGDTDMVALISVLLAEERRRREAGRPDHAIPFRPDHGHHLLNDDALRTHPGYPLAGRLRGLAELRGVATAIEAYEDRTVLQPAPRRAARPA